MVNLAFATNFSFNIYHTKHSKMGLQNGFACFILFEMYHSEVKFHTASKQEFAKTQHITVPNSINQNEI